MTAQKLNNIPIGAVKVFATVTERDAYTTPITGQEIYVTEIDTHYWWDGTSWKPFDTGDTMHSLGDLDVEIWENPPVPAYAKPGIMTRSYYRANEFDITGIGYAPNFNGLCEIIFQDNVRATQKIIWDVKNHKSMLSYTRSSEGNDSWEPSGSAMEIFPIYPFDFNAVPTNVKLGNITYRAPRGLNTVNNGPIGLSGAHITSIEYFSLGIPGIADSNTTMNGRFYQRIITDNGNEWTRICYFDNSTSQWTFLDWEIKANASNIVAQGALSTSVEAIGVRYKTLDANCNYTVVYTLLANENTNAVTKYVNMTATAEDYTLDADTNLVLHFRANGTIGITANSGVAAFVTVIKTDY